jgi:hypothetical protein
MARQDESAIQLRAVTVALFAGVIVAFAQTAPLVQAPIFFQLAKGFSAILAVLAIVPIIVALVLAGPIAGWLLARLEPRVLIAGGLATLGLGDLAFALADTGTNRVRGRTTQRANGHEARRERCRLSFPA